MKKIIILAAIILLAITTTGDAGISLGENSSLLLDRLTELHGEFGSEYPQMYRGLEERTRFIDYVSEKVYRLNSVFCENLIPLLLIEPPVDNPVVGNILDNIILIIQPFYTTAIILTALYLVLASGSPTSRKNAKSSLVRLMIGIGLIMLTVPIIQLLLEISHNLASLILSLFNPDPWVFSEMSKFFMNHFVIISFFRPLMGLPFLTLVVLMQLSVLILFSLRYFIIMIMTVFFPVAVLLYSFESTNPIGRKILNQILLWAFLPAMEALALGVTSIAVFVSPISEMRVFMMFAGSLLLIITPLMMLSILTFISSLGIFSIIVAKPLALLTASIDKIGWRND